MTDAERMEIVAQELTMSADELEALLSAVELVRVAISPSELIAAVARGDGIFRAVARQVHPSHAS